MAFKILGVDHIGVAVNDLEETQNFWTAIGLPCTGQETVAEQKVTTTFNPTPNGSEIELLAATEPDSPIAKFIEKNGGRGGVHHVAFNVESVEEALKEAEAAGIQLIDKAPRKGAENLMIAFLHPKSTKGVLTELCQQPK